MPKTKSGTVSWIDLSTPDIEGARRFYAGLLGWEVNVESTPKGEYNVASSNGREVAGMMAQDPQMAGTPAAWVVVVVVDDMEATLTATVEAGGAVLQPPMDIPGGARVSVVAAHSGAMFLVIGGGPEPDYPYYSEDVGAVCWAELMTGDVAAAIRFYGQVFQWTAETDETGPTPYTVFSLDGDPVAGMIARPDDLPADVPDNWSVYFTVDDCEVAQSRAVELGGSVILPATPTPMGPFAVLTDCAGAAFQVMEMVAAPEPAGQGS